MRRFVLASFLVPLVACGYDWTVGPRDGGLDRTAADAPSLDAAEEPRSDAGIPGDARDDPRSDVGAEEDARGAEAAQDVGARPSKSECELLVSQVQLDEGFIHDCYSSCKQEVPALCACPFRVQTKSAEYVEVYVDALNRLTDSGCPLDCGAPVICRDAETDGETQCHDGKCH